MTSRILTALIASSTFAFAQDKPKPHPTGYQDTPIIPGTKWHVHDGERPQPTVVTPGEAKRAGKSRQRTERRGRAF